MSEMMNFPDTWEEYEKIYGFNDSEEIYTNNSRLIPSFRVKQWLDHKSKQETKQQAIKVSDCISRQAAIDAPVKMVSEGLDWIPVYHLKDLPSAEPPTRCIAEVKFDKQDLEELVNEKIEEIKEIKSEHEDFLNFLCNVINPNDMEEYLAMYNSKGEAEG